MIGEVANITEGNKRISYFTFESNDEGGYWYYSRGEYNTRDIELMSIGFDYTDNSF